MLDCLWVRCGRFLLRGVGGNCSGRIDSCENGEERAPRTASNGGVLPWRGVWHAESYRKARTSAGLGALCIAVKVAVCVYQPFVPNPNPNPVMLPRPTSCYIVHLFTKRGGV